MSKKDQVTENTAIVMMGNEKKKYFMGHAVVVIKELSPFRLSKIKYFNETEEFIVDSKLISNFPIEEEKL